MPRAPDQENKPLTWPNWPLKLRTSSSHEEGCERDWAIATKEFAGRTERSRAEGVRVECKDGKMHEIAGQRI